MKKRIVWRYHLLKVGIVPERVSVCPFFFFFQDVYLFVFAVCFVLC